ncbi:cache domain-containing protein [Paenibacillus agricola]|uniref:Cache domain-containing protein n=1 Tax=Paenibacillus agricola TaxID=2716264 RepID=A0ABX0JHX1_9BACL|nr:cache domain-containing protein [Paenibacillus agricola]NHN35588.1 hypothetical protein [Paenibacillus agricola]
MDPDNKGRFIPWWIRQNGNVRSLPITDYDDPNATWYMLPKQTKKPVWLEPYIYSVDNQQMLITSVILPIIDRNDKFLGVIGIDYDISYLQELVNGIRPMGGFSSILTDHGSYIVHGLDPRLNGEMFDKNAEIIPFISKGLSIDMDDNSPTLNTMVKRVFGPIQINGIDGYWTYQSVIPINSMLDAYHRILLWAVSISIVILLLVMLMVSALIRRTIKPLHHTISLVEEVSHGN